jgi:hypothetical protein
VLDRTNGEPIDGLGNGFIVVPNAKWSDTAFWQDAFKAARESFHAAGAMLPVFISDQDVIVQEYPMDGVLAFLFHRKIAGEDYYHPEVFQLSPGVIAELKSAGRWTGALTH